VRRVAIGSCLLVALSGSPSASDGLATTATPFRLGEHHEPIIGVRVNGAGPFPFILDTGSTHSSIATELARALGVPAVARTTVTSSLGQHVQPVVNLESLQVGPAMTTNVLATEVADEELGNKRDVRGVLGQDVLGSLVYTIDFAARRVEWNPETGAQSPRGPTLSLRSARGRFLAELPQAESTLWLVPDSGAETLVLYERTHLQLPLLVRNRGVAWLSTLSDRQAVEAVQVSRLLVGNANLTDVPAVLVKRSDGDASLGDGLLPLAMFKRVTFDGPGGRLILER
jgi:predicted aspartyl protease